MAFGSKFGLGVGLLIAALAAFAPPRAWAQQPAADETAALIRQLNDASPDAEKQRDEAARRLVSRTTPEAHEAVINALRDLGNPAAQLSAAKALADAAKPDPAAIDALFPLIGIGNRPELTDAAAKALASFKSEPGVLTRLINLAQARTQPEWVRRPVIRAIGTLVEKRAAQFLIETTRSRDENQAIVNEAADALVSMTGLTENGRDLQRWERWWQANGGKNDETFRNDILASRVAPFDQLRGRYAALSREVGVILRDTYLSAPDAQKKETILRYLRNTEPEIRAVGAQLIFDDKVVDGRVIPPEVQEELRKMVGDSSTNVRLQVAKTLGALNDPAALQPLLAQLTQETDPDVRAAIATALGPIRDLNAVPPLLNVVNDDSFAVARAGADALKELGPKLREENPNLANQTATRLAEVLRKTEGRIGAQELRETLVEAMSTLRQRELIGTFARLLNARESVRVRRAALKGLGEIGDSKTADFIVPLLSDPQGAIRLEAVLAMQKTATIENADALANRIDQDSDEGVRAEAWKVFQSLLPQMEPPRLMAFADRFKNDPNQRLVILKTLADKQQKANDVDGLASTQENIAQVLMELQDPKAAAVYYQQALGARENDTGTVKERLVANLSNALLQSKQYAEAAKFAGDMLKKSSEFQDVIGAAFRNEAERLNKLNDPTSALQVIKQAESIDPPLAPKFLTQLRGVREESQKLADKSKGPSSDSTPRSAGSVLQNSTAGAE
jgi:HEAT repeat protein